MSKSVSSNGTSVVHNASKYMPEITNFALDHDHLHCIIALGTFQIRAELMMFGMPIKDVRLMKRKDTGKSR